MIFGSWAMTRGPDNCRRTAPSHSRDRTPARTSWSSQMNKDNGMWRARVSILREHPLAAALIALLWRYCSTSGS